MRTSLALRHTPADPADESQPREHPAMCVAHRLPTWRSDAYCATCLSELTSLRIHRIETT